MVDYCSVHVWSNPAEEEASFKGRLTAFWSHVLRAFPADFERVYAETSKFTRKGDRLGRQYLFEAEAARFIAEQFTAHNFAFDPVDEDDLYTKFEAAPPDWFQIEH